VVVFKTAVGEQALKVKQLGDLKLLVNDD